MSYRPIASLGRITVAKLFISGMILFWVIAALRYRAGLRPTESSSNAGLFI